MQLVGKTALVTGAAHRVGRAIAIQLARSGADVVVHYGGSAEAARSTAAQIRELGRSAWAIQADLASPAAIEGLFGAIDRQAGRLDLLINSAASFRKQSWDRIRAEDWDAALAVNLRAPFLCMQAAAKRMRQVERPEDEPALIVNICDLSGVHPWQGYVQHGVSKAGLIHLSRIAARELAPRIRCNAILPGAILPPPGVDPDSQLWQSLGSASPLGRPGDPSRIQQTIRYLVENDYVNGAVIPVDGGEHLLGPVNH